METTIGIYATLELIFTSLLCTIYIVLVSVTHFRNPYLFDNYAKIILVLNVTYLILVGIYPIEKFSEGIKLALIPLQHFSMQLQRIQINLFAIKVFSIYLTIKTAAKNLGKQLSIDYLQELRKKHIMMKYFLVGFLVVNVLLGLIFLIVLYYFQYGMNLPIWECLADKTFDNFMMTYGIIILSMDTILFLAYIFTIVKLMRLSHQKPSIYVVLFALYFFIFILYDDVYE
jgi:hypothetical protein